MVKLRQEALKRRRRPKTITKNKKEKHIPKLADSYVQTLNLLNLIDLICEWNERRNNAIN
jgi:hypothetical protein